MTPEERSTLREAAHRVLRDETGAVAITRLCPRCGSGSHGVPSARMTSGPGPAVSISYADGLVAVAWSRVGPVGIDIERVGPPVDGVDRRVWTQQEASFKAGEGEHALGDLEVPAGYLGTVAGSDVSWRLAGPGAPAR